jgi:hypothetical protein
MLETQGQRLDALFDMLDAARAKIEVNIEKIEKDLQTVTKDLSNFSARATVIIALGAFLGTAATSLLVTAIIKVLMR